MAGCNVNKLNLKMNCRSFALLFLLLLEVLIDSSSVENNFDSSPNVTALEEEFNRFLVKYNKEYAKDSKEYLERLSIFESNIRVHHILNVLGNESSSTARYGVTKFSDLTPEEFKRIYLSDMKPIESKHSLRWHSSHSPRPGVVRDVPLQIDWREHKAVSPVQNQKSCGGCWAFAALAMVESMYAIAHSVQAALLSVQQVLDCSYSYDVLRGCNGGDTCLALDWMQQTKVNLVSAAEYPLTDDIGICRFAVGDTSMVHVLNSTCDNYSDNEVSMLELIATHGPLAVSVDASNWNNYAGGVIQYHCGEVLSNHAAVIVGYNLLAPIPYYILKNSWGKDFGHDGYVYVKYGGNVCSLANHVSAVWVS